MKNHFVILLSLTIALAFFIQPSMAQDAVDEPAATDAVAEEAPAAETAALTPPTPTPVSIPDQMNEANLPSYYEPSPVDLNEMPSLFFTKWEHDLLIEARLGATTRPVVDGEDPQDTEIFALPDDPSAVSGAPGEVEIGGILYVSPSDWVVWINGARVTPTAIPTVIMDIRVFKNYVEMEWLDRATNQIYPIRLRAHQKFNLQSRMFLPAGG